MSKFSLHVPLPQYEALGIFPFYSPEPLAEAYCFALILIYRNWAIQLHKISVTLVATKQPEIIWHISLFSLKSHSLPLYTRISKLKN